VHLSGESVLTASWGCVPKYKAAQVFDVHFGFSGWGEIFMPERSNRPIVHGGLFGVNHLIDWDLLP
jgi:hypothetical protein